MEGRGSRVEGFGLSRVEGGGLRVEGGGWRVCLDSLRQPLERHGLDREGDGHRLRSGRGFRVHSHTVFFKSICRSQLPHKSVNVSFIISDIQNKLTDLGGNRLLQNDVNFVLC